MPPNQKIRFAPIIRVSTEKQEKQGESLRTQKKQIISYVELIGGTIPEKCWEYSGQEGATPGSERKKLDHLLADADKDIFDAVIVVDPSRWSRDNRKSKDGLDILRTNGIKFFVGTSESDLYDPNVLLFLAMSAEIGEWQARLQSLKSMQNRIERARRGIPAADKIPFGRTYDKETGKWGENKEEKRMLQMAAKRYISGENIKEIAASYNVKKDTLFRNLTQAGGPIWEQHFKSEKLNINETVITKIPPLLDEGTIKKIQERVELNKTIGRGNRKYNFSLTGFVFCKRCGYRLAPHWNTRSNIRYFVHRTLEHNKDCDFRKVVPADKLEFAVLLQLVQTFGDQKRLEAAIKRATPDLIRVADLKKEIAELKKTLAETNNQKERLISAVAEGAISMTDTRTRMDKLKAQEESIQSRQREVQFELDNIPDPEQVKKSAKWASGVLKAAMKDSAAKLLLKRDYEWRRELVLHSFTGVDNKGGALGIYVDYDKEGKFSYEIKGRFETTARSLTLTKEEMIDAFGLDPQYHDIDKEIESIKSNLFRG